jgi:hypothetical protein
MITCRGREFLERGTKCLRAVERLDVDLVPELSSPPARNSCAATTNGRVTAMKEVEVRRRAGLSNSLVGTKLVQEALLAAGIRGRGSGLTGVPDRRLLGRAKSGIVTTDGFRLAWPALQR